MVETCTNFPFTEKEINPDHLVPNISCLPHNPDGFLITQSHLLGIDLDIIRPDNLYFVKNEHFTQWYGLFSSKEVLDNGIFSSQTKTKNLFEALGFELEYAQLFAPVPDRLDTVESMYKTAVEHPDIYPREVVETITEQVSCSLHQAWVITDLLENARMKPIKYWDSSYQKNIETGRQLLASFGITNLEEETAYELILRQSLIKMYWKFVQQDTVLVRKRAGENHEEDPRRSDFENWILAVNQLYPNGPFPFKSKAAATVRVVPQ